MIYLVRFDEIFVKSERTRKRLINLILREIRRRFKVKEVIKERGRLIVDADESFKENFKYIFGISSISPAYKIENFEEILKFLEGKKVGSFAVRVHRAVKKGKTSIELEREIGEMIRKKFNWKVDLENPELTVNLEIRESGIYLYFEKIPGFGGFPIGSEGKLVSLFSGGMDSTVSTLLCMRRGCKIFLLFGNMKNHWSEKAYERLKKSYEFLKKFDESIKLFYFNLGEIHGKIEVEDRLRCLFCKGLMYRVGEILCNEIKAKGIVTGEAIGQVASQTLTNLFYLTKLVKVPIIRPLICMSKEEIKRYAEYFGCREITDVDVGKCKLVPKNPETRMKERDFEEIKRKIEEAEKYVEIEEY